MMRVVNAVGVSLFWVALLGSIVVVLLIYSRVWVV